MFTLQLLCNTFIAIVTAPVINCHNYIFVVLEEQIAIYIQTMSSGLTFTYYINNIKPNK